MLNGKNFVADIEEAMVVSRVHTGSIDGVFTAISKTPQRPMDDLALVIVSLGTPAT
jgi:hypothetical protein